MKKMLPQSIVSCLTVLGLIVSGCDGDFSEKDALNAQQTLDVTVYVTDLYNSNPLEDAQVTMLQDAEGAVAITDINGIAVFPDVAISDLIPVLVVLENYTTVQVLRSINTNNFRQAETTINVSLLSTTENLATLRGTLEIETDMTNDDPETVAEGTEVIAVLNGGLGQSNIISFTAAIDASGLFEFSLPASLLGIDYEIIYPTLTLGQTIAKNRDNGQPDFPETLPSIVEISTTFNPGQNAVSVPIVSPLYGTVAAPASGIQGIVGGIDVIDGSVSSVFMNNLGSGYTSTQESVSIISLSGGSGADVTVNVSGGSLSVFGIINVGGLGYPDYINANQSVVSGPLLTTSVQLKSGEIRVIDGSYGSGTSRAVNIE